MKLIFCLKCSDIVRLITENVKSCDCGQSTGQYKDLFNAWYKGPCIPIGISNSSFVHATRNQPENDWGETFEAFVIQKECETFENKNENENTKYPT